MDNKNENINDINKIEKREKINNLLTQLGLSILSSILATGIIFYISAFFSLPKEVKNLGERLDNVEARLDKLETNNDQTNPNISINVDIGENLQPIGNPPFSIEPNETDFVGSIFTSPGWRENDIIAKNIQTNENYTAKQLSNIYILLPYKTDNTESFFYGKYDSENQWDGKCLINIYERNNLKLIREEIYEHGILKSFKQVNKFTTKAGINVWNVSNREIINNYSTGENYYYFRGDTEFIKSFEYKDVSFENMLSVEDFINEIKTTTWIESYYNGNSKNENFSDNTETAYMIKYFKDGTVRTLYVGNFDNGDFDDSTGNAWYITKDINTNYMYYKGYFEKGEPTSNPGSEFENPVNLTRIKQILNDNNFSRELNWAVSIKEDVIS